MTARKKKVMFIDDDEAFLVIIERVSRQIPGIGELVFARDGEEALSTLRELADAPDAIPDIAFCDLNMPVLDGFGFLEGFRELVARHPALARIQPVVVLTSSEQDKDRERAAGLGASRFVVKGNTLSEIRAAISAHL